MPTRSGFHVTEGLSYLREDSGCEWATLVLGEPSCCLESCPFPECVLGSKQPKRLGVEACWQRGRSIEEIQEKFGMTRDSVLRMIPGVAQGGKR